MSTNLTNGTRSVNRLVGYVLGGIYLLVGLLGFAVTSDVGFADSSGESLLGFEVNPLHNIVHLLIGAALAGGAAAGLQVSRSVNITVGAVYLLVGIVGLFIGGDHEANILALNSADNVLHIVSAAVLLGVGFATDKTPVGTSRGSAV